MALRLSQASLSSRCKRDSHVDSVLLHISQDSVLHARRSGRGTMLSLKVGKAHEARVAWAAPRCFVFALRSLSGGPTVVARYPHSTDQRKELIRSNRDGARTRAPQRAGLRAPGPEQWRALPYFKLQRGSRRTNDSK